MARRRKSTGNGKSKEVKSDARNSQAEADCQDNEQTTKDSDALQLKQPSDREKSLSSNENDADTTNDQKQNSLMPLDIQQMILGDLQNVGQGEEIIVSREGPGDTSEELLGETETVVETSRQEEEYEIHTEEDEEEELVLMNEEEDGEENQYVIVVNAEDCDFEVTDDTSQEIVSIHNLSDFQEGSCEIITVVRESDYDSSQESVDDIEEGCGEDNINAVIGTVDGIHCVNISQYHSDDDGSNHDEQIETQEIQVLENETEVNLNNDTSLKGGHTGNGSSETTDSIQPSPVEKYENIEPSSSNCQSQNELIENNPNLVTKMEIDVIHSVKASENEISKSTTESISEFGDDSLLKSNLNKCELILEKNDNNVSTSINSVGDTNKQITIDTNANSNEDKSDNKVINPPDSFSLRPKNIREPRKGRNKVKAESNRNSRSNKVEPENKKSAEKEESTVYINNTSFLDNIQEHKVTSNCSTSESILSENSPLDNFDSTIPKKENVSSSNEYFPNQTINGKEDTKSNSIKEEVVMREEEDKQNTFRSRSGSTDTTGSESGSNSGSSRRRSGRIRSIGISKQKPATVPVVTSTTTPPVPGYEPDKPVKVKSRWRRSSELEMGSNNRRQQEIEVMNANARLVENVAAPPPPRPAQPTTPPNTPPPDKEVEDVLTQFQNLDCNEYHTERSKSKEAKRMICDCTLTKEEIARGDQGCGEDCLNRLLMIECGSRCMLGERCANKRFQNLEYAKCEVFKTELKGFGLRALEDIPVDTFLLEYVGEVLDPKEFRRRAKDYAKDKNQHFYFMALKSDSIIDATQKGNISRFINHSCDPNAETQKWTVNGELRVGFFSKRQISAGEEITFDYQLQRYGKEAQRCHCQTALCRGWIGEDPEKENKWSDLSGKNKERKEKERKKKEDKRKEKDMLNDIDLEEEIEKLVLKNRAQTLLLCRLMVRAEDHGSRTQLLRILQQGETACLRLFLDYHGLRLIWSWMMDPASDTALKIEILETLAKLPIQNKTMLQDSKVLSVVEKWATSGLNVADAKHRSSTEDESDKGEAEKQIKGESEKNSDDSNQSPVAETEEQQESNKKKILELSNALVQEWASLKEVFRIPKKERIEQMKEHEREADRLVFKDSSVEKQDISYDRHWSRSDYDRRDKDRDKDRKRGRGDSPDSDKSRKTAKTDDRQSQLTKLERRQLFAIKAAQEEEERLRRQQENMWQEQVHLAAQELAAQQASNFPPPGFPPPHHQWMAFPPPDGNMLPQPHMEGQPMFGPNGQHPPFPFGQNGPPLPQHPPFLDPSQHPPFLDPNHNSPFHNAMFSHPPPLPKQPLLPTPNHQPLLPTPPLPNQPLLPQNQPLLPNPPLPTQPFIPQNQPLLHTPPLPNQPHPMNLPPFSQPPLPTQPPPLTTTQPPTSLTYPVHEVTAPPPQQFPAVPQSQFSQPPPFTTQPPLPTQPPTPNPLPVFQTSLPAQFPATAVVPVTTAPVSPAPLYLPVKLPPKWKSAKDAEGRTYYYHVKTRVSQWEPPVWDYQQQTVVQESESETDSSDSDDDDSSSADEKEDEEKLPNEEEVDPIESLNDEDLGCEELPDSPYEPETMELLEDIEYDPKKKRKDVLVQERIISPRTADEIPDKLDKKKIRELKEKLRRQKAKEKLRQKQKNKSKSRSGTSKCEADTSSDPGRKIKDAFRLNMAGVIVHYLNAYRKPDCKIGKITNTEDFKHLARKLTHFVMLKELKHCRSVDELECNDNVKHKARDFIKKYMSKFGSEYLRPSDDD